jgi:hypothetical protein
MEAEENAIDLLYARVFQRGLEGDLEPLLYMGVPVGWVRKFSDKLQIELLRAYRPDQHKCTSKCTADAAQGRMVVKPPLPFFYLAAQSRRN